tara:strand:+ start:225 stop:638 length:414 start_codon:yes stop_codon:yes gene_type:complete
MREYSLNGLSIFVAIAFIWAISTYTMVIFVNTNNSTIAFASFFIGICVHAGMLYFSMDLPRSFPNTLKPPNLGQRVFFISLAIFHFCWSTLSLLSEIYSNNKIITAFWIIVGLNGLYFLASGMIKWRFKFKTFESIQ